MIKNLSWRLSRIFFLFGFGFPRPMNKLFSLYAIILENILNIILITILTLLTILVFCSILYVTER